MRIAVAADHRGFDAKRKLVPVLKQWGHEVEDFGCDGTDSSTDYPDFAIPGAQAVADGRCDLASERLERALELPGRGWGAIHLEQFQSGSFH